MTSPRARWSQLCLLTTYLSTLGLVLALCLSNPTRAAAQGTGGRILGRIADPTGAVLSGAKITATNDATGVTATWQTWAAQCTGVLACPGGGGCYARPPAGSCTPVDGSAIGVCQTPMLQ